MQVKTKGPWLFYALVAYIFIQFLWWEVLLARQSKQLAEERKKIIALNVADKVQLEQNLLEIDKKKQHQLWMHVGEGTVFLILLSLGVLKIYNTRKREMELARLQNNFLLSVTHELKSPLASVKLQLQTLQKHKLDEDTKGKLLQKALLDNERLARMVDNILLAARAENEKGIISKKKTDLKELIEKLIQLSFEESKARIGLSATEQMVLEVDEQVLTIILSNLIENALKYSPAGSPVEIRLKAPGQITVSDCGPGIPEAEKQKVFEKFYRIGNEETRNTKGTGLGLFIVKNLCSLHGIRIELMDNKPSGIIFTLTF